MSSAPIFFEFDTEQSAAMARETLEELGYRAGVHTEMKHPTVHLEVDHSELTSALEIAQAYGGRLVEREDGASELDTYAMAYDEADYIRIPAHVVNEDWDDSYATNEGAIGSEAVHSVDDEGKQPLDPSGDDYGYFDAGVHM
ncbi:hypothetical protein [Paenibacillus rigui]|uniref:Uncharacterized protein n=1 Tax=Paenibacillus rigui TaxID=554312 RepID=A0A229UNI1_9BACL|nr:hypothetical protein [Paenibacillus rigui]OXM84932.1 hypothetical protein CF651_18700 [Paenibacillus rigui]